MHAGFALACGELVAKDHPGWSPSNLSALWRRTGSACRRRLERARGEARLSVHCEGGRSRLGRLYQAGSARIRLPRVAASARRIEAVLINTAGGLTGGDRLRTLVAVERDAQAIVATQAAERVYRRQAGLAAIDTGLRVAAGGRLDWLPQETILFNRSGLARSLSADIEGDATLLAVEAIILGRTAMGETVDEVRATDTWRIRRDGKLIFADGLRLVGDATAIMAGGATGQGAIAFATLVLVAPRRGIDARPRPGGPRRQQWRSRSERLERHPGCSPDRGHRAGAPRRPRPAGRSAPRGSDAAGLAMLRESG